MPFDFYQTYLQAPNDELMKIVRQPDDYLPEAVEAAKKVLEERNVTNTVSTSLVIDIDGDIAFPLASAGRVSEMLASEDDIVTEYLQNNDQKVPNQWVQVVIALVTGWFFFQVYLRSYLFQYIMNRYNDCRTDSIIRDSFSPWVCIGDMFNLYNIMSVSTLIFIPVMIYLLYKGKRWGWILLFAETVYSGWAAVQTVFLTYYHPQVFLSNPWINGIVLAFRVGILLLLWRDEVADYMNVTVDTKKKTVVGAVCFTMMLMALNNIFN